MSLVRAPDHCPIPAVSDRQPLHPLVWCSDPLGAKVGQEADRASHQPDPQVGLGPVWEGAPRRNGGSGKQACRSAVAWSHVLRRFFPQSANSHSWLVGRAVLLSSGAQGFSLVELNSLR